MSGFIPSEEQRAILSAPVDAARIDAGAGTGKTTTLAERVAVLVSDHGIEPERILGITFTNKAAQELADRMRERVGGLFDVPREVDVHTYHGFAAGLLREHGPLVGVERNLRLVTPAYARQVLFDIVASTDVEAVDITLRTILDDVRGFASTMSDHLLTSERLRSLAEDTDVWRRRLELLGMIDRYEAYKRSLGIVDYGDLLARAVELVQTHPPVAELIADRYDVVLLDEYQDTNPAQRALLTTIFAGRPVLAVGDADQTIYEWRGASLANFHSFPTDFPTADGRPAPTFPLSTNRRSGAAILSVANRVRADIDGQPRLALVPVEGTPPGQVVTAWHSDVEAESDWIATEIVRLHEEEGLAWGDVGVLFRKNKDMAAVHAALERHDIPFEVANLGGLLGVSVIADLHAWLRILHSPADGPALVRILTGPRFRLGLGDLAVLTRNAPRPRDETDAEFVVPVTHLEVIDDLERVEGLDDRALDALTQFRHEYRSLLADSQSLSLVELCRAILDVTDVWSDIDALPETRALSSRLNLFRFLDVAEDWSPLEGRPSLGAFLAHLTAMEEESGEQLDAVRITPKEAVTLLTVHRAKGLEWEAVFVPAVYHRNFPSGVRRFADPFRHADVLPHEIRLDGDSLPQLDASMTVDERNEALRPHERAQEMRLAYVAITRARTFLAVSGAWWYGTPFPLQRPKEPGELFELIETDPTVERIVDAAEPERPDRLGVRDVDVAAPDPLWDGWPAAIRAAVDDPSWPAQRASELGIAEAYDAQVAEFEDTLFSLPDPPPDDSDEPSATSATGLVTYAACPKKYYWSHVDPLPRRYGQAAKRGVDVHRRIELHNLGVVPLDDAILEPDPTDVAPFESPAHPGQPGPYAVFAASRFASTPPVAIEHPFRLALGHLTVRGRIDAIYPADEGWEVVDFKTGRPSSSSARTVQLQTYALAVDGMPARPDGNLAVTFAYLGGGELVEESTQVDTAWMEDARRVVHGLAGGIADGAFEPTPSDLCRSCDFLRFCDEGKRKVGRP